MEVRAKVLIILLIFLSYSQGLSQESTESVDEQDTGAFKTETINQTSLNEKIEKNQQDQKKIAIEQKKAEDDIAAASSPIDIEYGKARLEIENFRKAMANTSKDWFDELKLLMGRYDEIQKVAAATQSSLEQDHILSMESYLVQYHKIIPIWRKLIDDGWLMYEFVFRDLGIGELPQSRPALLKGIDSDKATQYLNALATAKNEYDTLKSTQSAALEARISQYFAILSVVSEVRAQAINKFDLLTLLSSTGTDILADLTREFFAVPFRFIGIGFSRFGEIRTDLNGGVIGLWHLFKKLSAFSLLLFLPFFSRKFVKATTYYLDAYRKSLLSGSQARGRNKWKQALWIQRVTPAIPLVLYVIFLEITTRFVKDTVYEDLNLLIPIFQYFLMYRLFRLLVAGVVSSLQYLTNIAGFDSKALVERTTKIVGRFFLMSYSVLHLTHYAVDQGLIFSLVSFLMQIVGVVICGYAVLGWNEILAPAAKSLIRYDMGDFLARGCLGKFALFFCLPTLFAILIVILLNAIWDWLSELETSKKILTRFYRKKIEAMGANVAKGSVGELPLGYREIFGYAYHAPKEMLVAASVEQLKAVKKEITAWMDGTEEDQSIAIYGEKGSGKSTFLSAIANEFQTINVIRITVPPKIATKALLCKLLAESLGFDPSENLGRALIEFDAMQKSKMLVLVDDAHNLFVGRVGGFDALKALIEIVGLSTSNLFWCVAFNEYSWFYLKGVLGDSEYFRSEIRLKPWGDDSIRSLIKLRHDKTEFKLSFDRIIVASQATTTISEALDFAEEQFFRLLWEQSAGNPRVALYLWLNCLRYQGTNYLKVGLPERPKLERLAGLNDSSWFVLSAIVNHENGTRRELSDATNLGIGIVSNAIKSALEGKLIHKDSLHRYRLSFAYQHDLIRQLKSKNFIYGY